MSPLSTDTPYETDSPGSLSAEEGHSHNPGSEREGEEHQTGPRGSKRRQKNRDAARKSRRKQTERADELHEELQSLERSNSALHKEIAALKKELHSYETALERHKPDCRLRASAFSSSSSTHLSVSASAGSLTSPSPPGVPPKASIPTLAASPSLSTSLASSLSLRTLDRVERTHSAPVLTTSTLASSVGPSNELFTASSSPVTAPYSVSFSTYAAPHSSFSDEPLITSRPASSMSLCASLLSNPVPSTVVQSQSGQDPMHKTSSVSANVCFTLLTKQDLSLTASPTMMPPYSQLEVESTGVVRQCYPMHVPQLHPFQLDGDPNSLNPPGSLLPSPLQHPAPPSLSVTPNPAPLLSLLTVPSPLSVSQTTSSSSEESLSQPPPSLPAPADYSQDLSLSEFLKSNDWILGGTNNE